jgi:hypothetical protein
LMMSQTLGVTFEEIDRVGVVTPTASTKTR